MSAYTLANLDAALARENFKGVAFLDIQSLLRNPRLSEVLVECMIEALPKNIWDETDLIGGLDARGFILSGMLAVRLGKGQLLIRKHGKLPGDTIGKMYKTEYSEDRIEVQRGTGSIVLVDDVLATGGTISAASELVKDAGYTLKARLVLANLSHLNSDQETVSVLKYDSRLRLI
ncbi:MAG: adenine phosphoribosyltransferase [Pseudobdellovibrionaceae bacterium]